MKFTRCTLLINESFACKMLFISQIESKRRFFALSVDIRCFTKWTQLFQIQTKDITHNRQLYLPIWLFLAAICFVTIPSCDYLRSIPDFLHHSLTTSVSRSHFVNDNSSITLSFLKTTYDAILLKRIRLLRHVARQSISPTQTFIS